jgi:hypothetical protein
MATVVRPLPIATGARALLGAIFLVHGLNGFVNLMPQAATPVPDRALAFVAALVITGYVFPLINAIEIAAGVLLLSNRFVPLALTVTAPIVANIMAFYTVLAAFAPAGTLLAAAMLSLEVYLVWTYREAFRPLFAARFDGKAESQRHIEPRAA